MNTNTLVTCYESDMRDCYLDPNSQHNGTPLGMVPVKTNLDTWDGSNYQCGGMGLHMGIGQTKDGRWYVCHTSQFQGSNDYAYIIDEDEAKMLTLKHNPDVYKELFDEDLPVL